jgi:hypothetical protein
MLDQHRTVHIELSASEPEKTYCLRAEKGQHLQAEITNAQGVDPSGRVISPAGEMDGGPGGPFTAEKSVRAASIRSKSDSEARSGPDLTI